MGAVDTASADELGAATGEDIDGGVVLGQADGVVVGEQGDGGGEAQARRTLGDGGEDGRGGGDDVLAEVVLAEVERPEAELLGEGAEVDQLAEACLGTEPLAGVGVGEVIAEGDEANVHGVPLR